MTNPRLAVSFEGLGAEYLSAVIDDSTITYLATAENGSSQVGLAVRWSADAGVIELVGDGEGVLGRLEKVEKDGIATVQYKGFMKLKAGDGVSALTLMSTIVGDLGAASAEGYIREVATATAAELGLARGFVADDATLTEVLVCL